MPGKLLPHLDNFIPCTNRSPSGTDIAREDRYPLVTWTPAVGITAAQVTVIKQIKKKKGEKVVKNKSIN